VFLGRMKSAAAAQRLRFFLCLGFVLTALIVQASNSVFIATFTVSKNYNPDCSFCGNCQEVNYLINTCYMRTPEWFRLIVSACTSLPLMFSLRLMMTKDDLELLLHPHRFRADGPSLQPNQSSMEARLKAETVRMGVELR
jgi:hypothetical protein